MQGVDKDTVTISIGFGNTLGIQEKNPCLLCTHSYFYVDSTGEDETFKKLSESLKSTTILYSYVLRTSTRETSQRNFLWWKTRVSMLEAFTSVKLESLTFVNL